MNQRVIDIRVQQAQTYGVIVGLPKHVAEEIAEIADALEHAHYWTDVLALFGSDLRQLTGSTWGIRVDQQWSVLFEWESPWGAINIRLN